MSHASLSFGEDNQAADQAEEAGHESRAKVQEVERSQGLEVMLFIIFTLFIYHFRYSEFVPLYDLWKDYFTSCYGKKDPEKADDRLLKADYHGCLLLVETAVNASQVGIRGIVVRESRNTFLIITPDDRLLSMLFSHHSFS